MSEAQAGPRAKPGILDIAPYVPGRADATGGAKTFKLSSNETPLGASPAAAEAYRAAADKLHLYPDGSAAALRAAIAARFGLHAERIVCGAGSDELLQLIGHGYIGPGEEAIHTTHGFLVYPILIKANGANAVVAPERNHTADVEAILERVGPRTRAVFLANPNNPTGTYVPFDAVKRLHAGLPADCLLVLDAAYAEYVRRNDYEAGVELVATSNNVVMLRTFSKIYGLAALRLGWAYCPPAVADVLNRIRGPFNINAPAIAAGVAALADVAHVERAVAHNELWLPWLSREIGKLEIEITPSAGNFLLLHFPGRDGKTAAAADRFLSARGIVLRRMEAYHLPNALRMTVGSEEANRATAASLAEFMGGKG